MDLPAPLVNLENGTNLSGAARHGINSQVIGSQRRGLGQRNRSSMKYALPLLPSSCVPPPLHSSRVLLVIELLTRSMNTSSLEQPN